MEQPDRKRRFTLPSAHTILFAGSRATAFPGPHAKHNTILAVFALAIALMITRSPRRSLLVPFTP